MAEIVDFNRQRRHRAARRGFEGWNRRFSEAFDEHTRLMDLNDETLGILLKGGEASSALLRELIMGTLGMGAAGRFHFLENAEKIEITDIAVFLLDQIRFEAMRRLGWVDTHLTLQIPLVELVERFPSHFSASRHQTPRLSSNHPKRDEYEATFEGDRGAFVRRLIPEAIEAFEARLQGT